MAAESDQGGIPHSGQASERPEEVRFGYLLVALIILIILYPFHEETPLAYLIFAGVNTAVLGAAAFAASHSRRTLLLALLLAAPVMALQWFDAVSHDPLVRNLRDVAMTMFYGVVIFYVLREVLRPGPVTRDKISGAVAAYMLAAVAWTALYGLTDSLVPGSFSIYGHPDTTQPASIRDLLYFSVTTLTTTGYGDITPLSRHAQSLAILEQMFGTFYVAVLIARLAGLYQPSQSKPPLSRWRPWRPHRPSDGGAK